MVISNRRSLEALKLKFLRISRISKIKKKKAFSQNKGQTFSDFGDLKKHK